MSEPMDSRPVAEVLDQGGSVTAPRAGRRPVWPLVVGAAAVVAVSSAGVALGMALGGGGTQPEEVMPAQVLAYADLDFDPDAQQKVDLVRLLNKFPDIEAELGDGADLKGVLVEKLFETSSGIDADEVTSWLGDRAGIGVLWDEDAGAPVAVIALQVSDESAARETLTDHYDDSEFAFESGYVVITPAIDGVPAGMEAADVLSLSRTASLAEDPGFVEIMDPLGPGLASAYADGDAINQVLADELGALGMPDGSPLAPGMTGMSGQLGAVLRAEPTALEIEGRSTEVTPGVAAEPTELMDTLPPGTAAAFALGGGGAAVAEGWGQLTQQLESLGQLQGLTGAQPVAYSQEQSARDPQSQFEREIAQIEAEYNIRLPDDLITVSGEDFVVAVDAEGLLTAPGVGIRSVTDPEAAADLANRIQPVLDDVTAGYGVTVRPLDDGLVIASSSEYADELAAGGSGFLADPKVRAALPDTTGASALLFIDCEVFSDLATLAAPEVGNSLDPLEAVGVAAGVDDDGQFFRARLTFDD